METYNFSKSEPLPDYVNEHDVLGLVKSKRTSMIKRLKFKLVNAPELDVEYAGLGIRTLATFIDLVIIAGLMISSDAYRCLSHLRHLGLEYGLFQPNLKSKAGTI